MNHEDSIVVSESALNKMRSTKSETILIPIYEYSMFRTVYPNSPYKFLPMVGQSVNDNIVTFRNSIKPGSNAINALKNVSISELASIANDDKYFNSVPITCRIPDSKVLDIRVHIINNQLKLIDKNLDVYLHRIMQDYEPTLKTTADSLRSLFTRDFSNSILATNYVMINKIKNDILDKNQIVYLIELKLGKDSPSHLGDKFTNRYANKGVCSLVLPDELRPRALESDVPIDFITGPITGVGRMNFGQFIEGYISKAITKSESIIKNNNDHLVTELYKISQISDVLKDFEYANQIRNLAESIKNNSELKKQFLNSINEIGLYFEAPGFANFQLKDLEYRLQQNWNVNSQEPIHFSKECIDYIGDRLKIKHLLPSIPKEGQILPNIFCAPIYTLKLKQESYYRSSARDFGSYKSNNYQPVQGRSSDGFIGGSARLGQMELI